MRIVGFSDKPAVRAGGEGYAVPVVACDSGRRELLKIYKSAFKERHERIGFLSSLKLHEVLPTYAGAPTMIVSDKISATCDGQVNQYNADGLICPFVEGEEFGRLLKKNWAATMRSRVHLAHQLCQAVRVFEGSGLVHGDLSCSNILIEKTDHDLSTLRWIDFDGFYHPSLPALPLIEGGRGFGSNGYRSYVFTKQEVPVVNTDRVAMAALAYELVVFQSSDLQGLQRETLIDQQAIDEASKQTAPQLPAEITNRWPEGWELVRRAFSSSDPQSQAPSPDVWCQSLSDLGRRLEPQLGTPTIQLNVEHPSDGLRVFLIRKSENSLQAISPGLAGLRYQVKPPGLVILGTFDGMLFHRRGDDVTRYRSPVSLSISVGDRLTYRDVSIDIVTANSNSKPQLRRLTISP